jgi:hypothetical protein
VVVPTWLSVEIVVKKFKRTIGKSGSDCKELIFCSGIYFLMYGFLKLIYDAVHGNVYA